MSLDRTGDFQMSKMNTSNYSLNPSVPERIDLLMGSRPDARIEGTMEQQYGQGPTKLQNGGPVKELTAASALTSLVKPHSGSDDGEGASEFEIPQRFTKSGRKKATPFPMKLMKVLSEPEYNDTIMWLPDGKSFTIVRPKHFVTDILPQQFKQAKYSSFTRKLHRWGFQRHLRGEEAGAFFHKMFQRGRPDLAEKMTCYKADNQSKANPTAVAFRDPVMSRQPMNRALMMQQSQQFQPQQNLFGMHEQLRPMHHPSSVSQRSSAVGVGEGESTGSVDRLNAAIELEVNRRLKERFNAATLSRHALSLMQPNNDRGQGGAPGNNSNNNNNMNLGLNLLGGQDSLGSPNPMSLHQQQLQQQQAQLAQLQQQLQQQGLWGGQSSFGFDNNQGM